MKNIYIQITNLRFTSYAAVVVAILGCSTPLHAQVSAQVTEGEGMTLDYVTDCIEISAHEIDMGIANSDDPANYEHELGREMAAIQDDVQSFVVSSFEDTNIQLKEGLELFKVWYVQHLQQLDEEDRTERAIGGFISNALSLTLNFAFPGSGQVATHIRQIGASSYQAIYNSATTTTERSPEEFIQLVITNMELNEGRRQRFIATFFQNIDNPEMRQLLDGIKAVEAMARRRDNLAGRERQLHQCAEMIFSRVGIFRANDQVNRVRRYFLQNLIKQVKCAEYEDHTFAYNCTTEIGQRNAVRESNIETRRLLNENHSR